MKTKPLVFAFIVSISLISLIGIYALKSANETITSFEEGNKFFKDNATAATELSSYAKRAEGHLLLYLTLHRTSDKNKFPKRVNSLFDRISILDQKLDDYEARTILDKIQSNAKAVSTIGNTLITQHDNAMGSSGKFNIEQHQEAIWTLHDHFSSIRKFGVELATLEINTEHQVKIKALENANRLQFYMLIMLAMTLAFTFLLGYMLIKTLNNLNSERNKLEDALAQVNTLSGLLPICAECKNIRDDKGYWKQIESYIREHSEAEFSHSICPSCFKKLYPDLNKDKE